MMIKFIKIGIVFFIALALQLGITMAVASFQVTSFSCDDEAVINSLFSCSATIQNTGNAAGTLSTVTLYPDSDNWLESSNYLQSYGQSVDPSNSISITFSGLRAVKSGNNGFSKIMLDSVTDTYVADNNKKVNIINVAVTVSNSASSLAMGGTSTATTEVTAGGNIDVSLSFTSTSGGCSVGSQTNPKSITGMTDGSKQSRTWTITQGTSGDCKFTISAAATGSGGVASKIDSTSSTITCTDCPVQSSGSSSSGGGGGGGSGGGASGNYVVGDLNSAHTAEMRVNEKLEFNVISEKHILSFISLTETDATIEIESEKQTFVIKLGETISVDLNKDNEKDISIYLKSLNFSAKKAIFVITSLFISSPSNAAGNKSNGENGGDAINFPLILKSKYTILVIIGIIALAIVIYLIAHRVLNRYDLDKFKQSVKVK